MQRATDIVLRVPDEVQRAPDIVLRVPDEVQRAPDEVQRAPDDVQRGPDKVQRVPYGVHREADEVQRAPSNQQRATYTCKCAWSSLQPRPDGVQRAEAGPFASGAACSVDLTECSGRVTRYSVKRATSA